MAHRIFTVEITSAGGWGGQHDIVPSSGDPIDAVIEALKYHLSQPRQAVEAYDEDNDPNGSYTGWSRVVISIDGKYDDRGNWQRECDPPDVPTPMELLAEVDLG
jgi:hypothetical protein